MSVWTMRLALPSCCLASDVNLEGFACHLGVAGERVRALAAVVALALGVVWKPRRRVDVLVERRVVRYTGSKNIFLLCNYQVLDLYIYRQLCVLLHGMCETICFDFRFLCTTTCSVNYFFDQIFRPCTCFELISCVFNFKINLF